MIFILWNGFPDKFGLKKFHHLGLVKSAMLELSWPGMVILVSVFITLCCFGNNCLWGCRYDSYNCHSYIFDNEKFPMFLLLSFIAAVFLELKRIKKKSTKGWLAQYMTLLHFLSHWIYNDVNLSRSVMALSLILTLCL